MQYELTLIFSSQSVWMYERNENSQFFYFWARKNSDSRVTRICAPRRLAARGFIVAPHPAPDDLDGLFLARLNTVICMLGLLSRRTFSPALP
uniref:Uncharacterized protein n=1 Tax=Pararge aegeria TaxID=116150 RepID=S4NV51_9NEOP